MQSIRADAFTFYSLTTSSFLTSAVDEYGINLALLFHGDAATTHWLAGVWAPDEARHGRWLRAYVEDLWPDFDWDAAQRDYLGRIPRRSTDHLQPSRALEALARCVTEAQATMMYRCLADYTSDPQLAEMLRAIGQDDIRHYREFQRILERYEALERPSLYRKGRTIVERSALVRTRDLALAFRSIPAGWRSAPPFEAQSYARFMARARPVLERHFAFDAALRMMLRPLEPAQGTLLHRYLASAVSRSLLSGYKKGDEAGDAVFDTGPLA
jgi:hypothetical protein